MPKLYLFRHGETPDNREHIFSGTRDVELTETGIAQARELAVALKDISIQVAYCSPMKRTRKTMAIALESHKIVTCLDPRLIERSYGILQGKDKDDLAKESLQLFKFFHRSYYVAPPSGESLFSVDKRVRPFIKDVILDMGKRDVNVAVCAHGNSLRAIRIFCENRPQSEFNKIETHVGQLFEYEITPVDVERALNMENLKAH